MAKAKQPKQPKVAADEKINKEVPLFDVLNAIDNKDYNFYKNLTDEQRKSIPFHMIIQWISAIKGRSDVHEYYLQAVDTYANKYMYSEGMKDHNGLLWLMLCAASPGMGKQFHQWIPRLSERITWLQDGAKIGDVEKFFSTVYPKVDKSDIKEISTAYVEEQNRKVKLAKIYPYLKIDELELLNRLVTDADINKHERDSGN